MKTEIIKIKDRGHAAISKAAEIMLNGGLCAFPTETVYGLGAIATEKKAVAKIFAAKGRPQDNPLILHITGIDMLAACCKDIPDTAYILADAFWPGPLTMVLWRNENIPSSVACELETIAVRAPENPIALALIEACGKPIAAPSANLSGTPSPTTAAHVAADLSGRIEMILDGGACEIGLESTIIDLTAFEINILRTGAITQDMLEAVLGRKITAPKNSERPKAPGMKYRHYAPKARIIFLPAAGGQLEQISDKLEKGVRIGVLASKETACLYDKRAVILQLGSRDNHKQLAQNLYACLRKFDEYGVDEIYSEVFDNAGLCAVIMNRLNKAARSEVL